MTELSVKTEAGNLKAEEYIGASDRSGVALYRNEEQVAAIEYDTSDNSESVSIFLWERDGKTLRFNADYIVPQPAAISVYSDVSFNIPSGYISFAAEKRSLAVYINNWLAVELVSDCGDLYAIVFEPSGEQVSSIWL